MFYTTTSRVPALRNAFREMRHINRMFADTLGTISSDSDGDGTLASAWMPPCDIFENEDTLKIVMEIPGVQANDVKISLENSQLSIRGEKRQEAEESSERVHRYERSYGSFERVFTLPTTIDAESIQANVEDGVLILRLPKVERARPREIPVQAGTKALT